jgi:SAM-dependent methyltransferase
VNDVELEIRSGDLADEAFDGRLPEPLQDKAPRYFTPVAVAREAARLLAPRPGMSVLDVGSGVGKFCIAAANEVPTATFTGVEWRPQLVHLAMLLARQTATTNARFILADALEVDWSTFDSFYFFNPFAEQLFEPDEMLDATIELDPTSFSRYVTEVWQRLARAPIGTRVATYHGFGGSRPPGYEQVVLSGSPQLQLWIKTSDDGRHCCEPPTREILAIPVTRR